MKIGMRTISKVGGGAGNFLGRLNQAIENSGDAEVVGSMNIFQDIGLYSSVHQGLPWAPYVLRLDGVYFDRLETHGSNRNLNKKIYRSIDKARGVIFQSVYCRELVETHYGHLDVPNVVILNGARVQHRRIAARKKAGFEQGRNRTIICAAKWRKHKRLEAVIEVVRKLNKNGEYELVVLGEVNEGRVNDSFVTYVGQVPYDSISKYFEKADLFLHLCWLDSCPNAVVEAITHGLPVVCSNQGGTPEIVSATNGGMISKCDDTVDYTRLVDLYNPPMPDIDEVASSVQYVFKNYGSVLNRMNFSEVDIALTAGKYLAFCKQIINSKHK